MHKRANGFTLIEVLLCLVVLATLMGVAVPAWSSMLARSHSASARAALLASLTTSINHAAVAGTEVVLCPATTLDCADSWDWSQGWIAYADLDGDRHHDAGEALLRQQPALHDDVRLLTSKGRKRLVIQPNGGNAGSNVTFTLCAGRKDARPAVLVLSNTGRLRDAKAAPRAAKQCIAAPR